MEPFINDILLGQEIEVLCLGGSKFEGVAAALRQGVLTLEWEDRKTHVACDKIVAAWNKEDAQRPSAALGFAPR